MRDQIETERLLLRLPMAGDADEIACHARDRDVARMLGSMPHPYPATGAEDWIAASARAREDGEGTAYVVRLRPLVSTFVGVIGVEERAAHGDTELGFWIGRAHWGHGYACEAARAVIDELFNTTNAPGLACECFTDNPASERVIRDCGFRFAAIAPRWSEARRAEALAHSFWLDRAAWTARASRTAA